CTGAPASAFFLEGFTGSHSKSSSPHVRSASPLAGMRFVSALPNRLPSRYVTVADQNVTPLPNRRLEALERRIAENIFDAVLTVEQFNIHEQPGSAERLDEIAFLAAKLSNELNELC